MWWIIYRFSWLDKKNATISPINKKYNISLEYVLTVALNYEEIKEDPQRIANIKPFIYKYNWEGINVSSLQKHWEKNVTIALNVLDDKKQKSISCLSFKT